jgi:hypothetical protein
MHGGSAAVAEFRRARHGGKRKRANSVVSEFEIELEGLARNLPGRSTSQPAKPAQAKKTGIAECWEIERPTS